MFSTNKSKSIVLFLALLAGTVLTACSGKDKELLANPKVGDLYAAEITHFSSFADDSGEEVEEGYGLLKVTGVSDRNIKVVTTSWYQSTKRGILKELRKYQAPNQWDRMDVITLNRTDLLKLYDDGQIFDVRRNTSDNGASP